MKEIGEYLKEKRINNGVGVREVSDDLDISVDEIENIELGNIRAFKDILELKKRIKIYAKYLGLDTEKLMDEFNDFLFEHTSKISLDDIKIAKDKLKEEEEIKKVKSPYTIIKEKNIKYKYIIGALIIVLLVITITLIITSFTKDKPNTELLRRNDFYEFAN